MTNLTTSRYAIPESFGRMVVVVVLEAAGRGGGQVHGAAGVVLDQGLGLVPGLNRQIHCTYKTKM